MKLRKILIADDSSVNVKLIREILLNRYETISAPDGPSCIKSAKQDKPDLILLDIMMPEINGYEVCRLLKSDSDTAHIPVIFITSKKDMDDIICGFEAGGVDYITKPFNSLELIARIDTHVSLVTAHNDLKTYSESLEMLSQQLLEKTKLLDTMVRTDFLTGLANRLHIIEQIKREESRFNRGTPLCSIIIADIDYFKKINDTYGHEAGDLVLKAVADIFKINTRKQDITARWGGEEFLFLLPETPGEAACKFAEKVRSAVEQTPVKTDSGNISVTMTFGVCEFIKELSVDGTIRMADNALYNGKSGGRNCVQLAVLNHAE